MAVTKILARHARLDLAINYAVNPDKTDEEVLTAYLNCDKGHACHQMLATKEAKNNRDGVQYYHIIQSFKPGEITPELALEIAQAFAKEHLADYEVVIGVHVDKEHIHAHMVFNSVNLVTGRKYHSNAKSYYQQIRTISDKLCREHGLSVIMEGKPSKAVSYIEWLRQSKGQPTFRSMLEADLRDAIADANDTSSTTATGWVSDCAGRSVSCIRNAKTRHIQKKTLNAPLRAISRRLKPVADRRLFRARNRSHIARIQNIRDSLHYTTITAICLAALKSDNIRRA